MQTSIRKKSTHTTTTTATTATTATTMKSQQDDDQGQIVKDIPSCTTQQVKVGLPFPLLFEQLPSDLIIEILCFLTLPELARLQMTSKQWITGKRQRQRRQQQHFSTPSGTTKQSQSSQTSSSQPIIKLSEIMDLACERIFWLYSNHQQYKLPSKRTRAVQRLNHQTSSISSSFTSSSTSSSSDSSSSPTGAAVESDVVVDTNQANAVDNSALSSITATTPVTRRAANPPVQGEQNEALLQPLFLIYKPSCIDGTYHASLQCNYAYRVLNYTTTSIGNNNNHHEDDESIDSTIHELFTVYPPITDDYNKRQINKKYIHHQHQHHHPQYSLHDSISRMTDLNSMMMMYAVEEYLYDY